MSKHLLLSVLLFAFLFPATLQAQPSIGVHIGYSNFDLHELEGRTFSVNNAPIFEINAEWELHNRGNIYSAFRYVRHSYDETWTVDYYTDQYGNISASDMNVDMQFDHEISLSGGYTFKPFPDWPLVPFATLGLGFSYYSPGDHSVTAEPIITENQADYFESQLVFEWMIRGGARYAINQNIGIQVNYSVISSDQFNSTLNQPIMVGISYQL